MEDISEYFAERACRKIQQRIAGSSMTRGLFERTGKGFLAYNNYYISFQDTGETIDITVDNARNGSIGRLSEELKNMDFSVPESYKPIISHVGFNTRRVSGRDELVMTIRPRVKGPGGRKRNKDKLYNSSDNCAISKLMLAIYNSS